jgi:hypothetical protein
MSDYIFFSFRNHVMGQMARVHLADEFLHQGLFTVTRWASVKAFFGFGKDKREQLQKAYIEFLKQDDRPLEINY